MLKQYRKARDILMDIGLKYRGESVKALFREELKDQNIEIDEKYLDSIDNGNNEEDELLNAVEAKKQALTKEGYGIFDRSNFFKALRQDKTFRLNFIGIVFCHAISAFSFSLFTFMLPSLKGNIFLNGFLIGSFEILAYSISGLMMKMLGLRIQIVVCYIISFVSAIIYQFIDTSSGSQLTEAAFLSFLMFGVAANCNSTAYAAYMCSP